VRFVPKRLTETALWRRWHKLASEFAKFGTIGVINVVVNYGVFNALLITGLTEGRLKANIAATVVATTSSYFMNRYWTYRDRPKSTLRREYVLFFAFNLVGLLIELGVLGLAVYGFGMTSLIASNVAKTIGMVIGTVFRFWSYRTFVFPAAPAPAAASSVDRAPAASHAASADRVPAESDALVAEFDQLTAPLQVELAGELTPGGRGARPPRAT